MPSGDEERMFGRPRPRRPRGGLPASRPGSRSPARSNPPGGAWRPRGARGFNPLTTSPFFPGRRGATQLRRWGVVDADPSRPLRPARRRLLVTAAPPAPPPPAPRPCLTPARSLRADWDRDVGPLRPARLRSSLALHVRAVERPCDGRLPQAAFSPAPPSPTDDDAPHLLSPRLARSPDHGLPTTPSSAPHAPLVDACSLTVRVMFEGMAKPSDFAAEG